MRSIEEEREIDTVAIDLAKHSLIHVKNDDGQIISIQNPVRGAGFVINGFTNEMACDLVDNNTILIKGFDSGFPSIMLTGGREITPHISLVPSNYHDKEPEELLIRIDGAVSINTLLEAIEWAKSNAVTLKMENGETVLLDD
jgi:hypothetical protein